MRTGKFVKAFQKASRPKTQGYDTQAEVRRVEGGTAWVHIPGGVDETPVKLTIDAKAGDTVQVRVSGGKAFLVGNATAPPTDDTLAVKAVQQVAETNVVVETVKKAVAAVAKIAGNTNQYFWHTESGTDTGVHITEIPQDDFLADPANGGGNLLARSNGIAVRDGLTELATFGADGTQIGLSGESHQQLDYHSLKLVDSDGNTYLHISDMRDRDNHYPITNTYTANGATVYDVSVDGGSVLSVTQVLIDGVEQSADTYQFNASNETVTFTTAPASGAIVAIKCVTNATTCKAYTLGIRRSTGKVGVSSFATGYDNTSSANYTVATGHSTVASHQCAVATGEETKATGYCSHASGYRAKATAIYANASGANTTASGAASNASGVWTTASGTNANASGNSSTASGHTSHAEGYNTKATALYTHSEGQRTEATASSAHAEGWSTYASGDASHSEGHQTHATGPSSHAQNRGNYATRQDQTALGRFNSVTTTTVGGVTTYDAGDYAVIIGNGISDSNRSNALTVDWSGNVSAAGQVKSTPTTGSVTITSGIFSSTWLNTQAVAGNMVNISIAGTFTNTSAKSWTTIGTVTNPPAVKQQGCFWGGGTDSGVFRIETDGTISVTTASGVAQCRFNTSYIMG